ncbi:MAG: 4-hydroxy-3-methylbut-2-enyl diphosphate reductase [Dehalococcoidia bacterium]|nr:MAG: 4-hydroxy-3-methylbut-2-enyl diphosphate reductase [Dehalococcoidia bacterium]
MEIEKASEMGFCFGVRRAIDMVERAACEKGPLKTLGALVHNPQVVDRLATCGVNVVTNLDDIQGHIIAIASHGVGPGIMEQVQGRSLEVIDATCPFVRKAQVAARKMSEAGLWVLVYGDAAHPEVRGVLEHAGENASASLEVPDLDSLPSRLGILCQTTQNPKYFTEFLAGIISQGLSRFSELRICNTICDATSRHQAAALELAGRVDLMFVVGGKDSANTKRLARICTDSGVTTFHIEDATEIEPASLQGHSRIGITAGASTPDEVIDTVVAVLNEHVSRN